MYHYVRPDNEEYPNFNHLNIDVFKAQLDYFQKKYGFISQENYKESIKTGKNIDGVVLTFDDGFKDHFTYVMPELKKRGLWGIFYIPTGVYTQKKLLGVHRVHYLKGKYGASTILNELTNKIKDFMLDESLIKEFDKEIYLQSSYDNDEKQLRRLLNYYIKYDYRDVILDSLMEKLFDEKELYKSTYLSKKEIAQLSNNGNIIGSHTVSHKVLSRLNYEEQFKEINDSFDFLDTIMQQDYKSFCYPYGYKSSYNKSTLQILEQLKIDDACVFDNNIQGKDMKKYEISRIDCNQFMEL